MAELFILELEDFDEARYESVNRNLGIDMSSDDGNWPPGIISHTAGRTQDGWIVVEVWQTKQDQEAFMNTRLGPALHQAGVDKPPKRAEWAKLKSNRLPRKPSGNQ